MAAANHRYITVCCRYRWTVANIQSCSQYALCRCQRSHDQTNQTQPLFVIVSKTQGNSAAIISILSKHKLWPQARFLILGRVLSKAGMFVRSHINLKVHNQMHTVWAYTMKTRGNTQMEFIYKWEEKKFYSSSLNNLKRQQSRTDAVPCTINDHRYHGRHHSRDHSRYHSRHQRWGWCLMWPAQASTEKKTNNCNDRHCPIYHSWS